MATVEIYSSFWCPYCHRAKNLLKGKGVEFKEIEVDNDPKLREEMTRRAGGGRSVPQIFIDGRHIGGSDELARLDAAGKLDPLLGRAQ